MAQLLDFIGGPCAGKHVVEGTLSAMRTFARKQVPGQPRQAEVAAYRLDESSGTPKYHFIGMGRPARFRNGPLDGHEDVFMGNPPPTFEAHNPGPTGKIIAVAKYELKVTDLTEPAIYELAEIVDLQTDEDKALAAIYQFYKQPNPSIYSIPPGLHKEIWIELGNRRASVDEDIADLIKAVWVRGWETIGSCQERPAESEYAGMGYVSFPLLEQGKEYAAVLEQAGIEHKTLNKTFRVARKTNEGEMVNDIELPALNVFFYKRDVIRIITALNA